MDRYGTGLHRSRLHPSVRLVRFGHPISRLRHDMFRRRQRHLQFTLRIRHEVHRQETNHGVGRHSPYSSGSLVPNLETPSVESGGLLHRIGTVGCRRRRVADAS